MVGGGSRESVEELVVGRTWMQAEDGSGVGGAAVLGGAVEESIGAGKQGSAGVAALIRAAREVVQDFVESSVRGDSEHGAIAGAAAVHGVAVKQAVGQLDQGGRRSGPRGVSEVMHDLVARSVGLEAEQGSVPVDATDLGGAVEPAVGGLQEAGGGVPSVSRRLGEAVEQLVAGAVEGEPIDSAAVGGAAGQGRAVEVPVGSLDRAGGWRVARVPAGGDFAEDLEVRAVGVEGEDGSAGGERARVGDASIL